MQITVVVALRICKLLKLLLHTLTLRNFFDGHSGRKNRLNTMSSPETKIENVS